MKNVIVCLAIGSAVLLSACKKESKSPDPVLSDPTLPTLANFYSANAAVPQTFTFDAATTQTLNGAKGSVIMIPSTAFITKTGAIVTGNVELSVTEIFSKKDMILNKTETATANNLLTSAGEIKFTATQNGQELKLYPGKKLNVKMPAGTSPSYSMQVFHGLTDFTSNNLVWALAASFNTAPPVYDPINLINPYYYSFVTDSLNWNHCAEMNNTSPKTNYSITVHGNYNSTNTNIFLVFASNRSVAYLYPFASQTYYTNYQVPIGSNVTIVAISRVSGNFYASYTNATITSNFVLDINLNPTSETEILNKLATF